MYSDRFFFSSIVWRLIRFVHTISVTIYCKYIKSCNIYIYTHDQNNRELQQANPAATSVQTVFSANHTFVENFLKQLLGI